MAITSDEFQSIVSAVLSSIRTNSRTIAQLTPVSTLSDSDSFEINGGKRVTYGVLKDLVASLSLSEQDSLRTLINKCELKSVGITVGESSATLTISSIGKTITTSIPIATSSKSGLMSAADKVKLQASYDNGQTALSKANAAEVTANAAKAVTDTKGLPGGLATLDLSGKVPSSQLPGYVDDVVEFNAMVSGVTTQLQSSQHKSSDTGCMVVYDKDKCRLLLAVSNRTIADNENWGSVLKPAKVQNVQSESNVTPQLENDVAAKYELSGLAAEYWQVDDKTGEVVIIEGAFTYFANWDDADTFGATYDAKGRIPDSGKIYTCTSSNKTYRWSGSELITIGSDLALGHTASTAFPGDEGAKLQEETKALDIRITDAENHLGAKIEGIAILPFDGFYDDNLGQGTGVWFRRNPVDEGGNAYMWCADSEFPDGYQSSDYNNTLNGLPIIRTDRLFRCGNELYRYGEDFVKIGGASVGNTYNLTAEVPTSDPDRVFYHMSDTSDTYYAPSVVLARKKAMLGLQITFAIAKGAWKTYQYIGTDLLPESVKAKENWLDLAGMSAGTEAIVNIDDLCGSESRTLSMAIQALMNHEATSGVPYRKEGLIITYMRDADTKTWETKQFIGALADFKAANTDLWKDFGNGGGSDVKTSDAPEENGKDAFSTGGAYEMEKRQFGGLEIMPDPDDYVIQATDRKGTALGDPVKIPKSNGGGQQQGSTLTIYCEQAIRGAFGSTLELRAALKSVSFDGDTEVLGFIDSIGINDPSTGITLWSEKVDEKSSTTANDTKFVYPFTDLVTEPTSRDFTIWATDKDGNRRSRNVTVSAVDVTCECVQKLQYTAGESLTVGGDTKSLPMYRFARNVGKEGIEVTTEMFYDGEWRELGKATVRDSYSHNISINPSNVFGNSEQLTHGGWLIRMRGKDIASGVSGNTVYTTIMCLESGNTAPIAAIRWDDSNEGKIRLYDNLNVWISAYTPGANSTVARLIVDGHTEISRVCGLGEDGVINVTKQIQGYPADGTKSLPFHAESGEGDNTDSTSELSVTIQGSAIAAELKEGAEAAFDFSNRDNDETDHSITDNGHSLIVTGANWNSNGYRQILGENTLRVAENVKAETDYAPFWDTALETGGMAFQMAFSTKNVRDKSAKLCTCQGANGAGFYITGNEMVMTMPGGTPDIHRVKFRSNEKVTLAIVVEPGSKKVTYTDPDTKATTEYAMVKMYVNGELVGAMGYRPGTGMLRQSSPVKFNSEGGDIAVNYMLWYTAYMEWEKAFDNYLCKLSDTTAMIAEYDSEDVLKNGKPSIEAMEDKKIPYYVVVAAQEVFDMYDNGTDTSQQFACTLFYFNPQHPEVNFRADNVLWRRQGTTSAQRPVKNDRFNLNKKNKSTGLKATVTLLGDDETTVWENPSLRAKAKLAAKHNKVYVSENGLFVDTITVKVDYSDSSNANDCGVCDMMNATFRTMGSEYMTPAQRAFDGTQDLGGGDKLTGLMMDHSTKNHPIAAFRATNSNLTDAWFHAKGNWKEDKGEQIALGFKDTPGYNKGCLNYGDFKEFFGNRNETLSQIETRFKATDGLDTEAVYLLSQYCGRDYLIMRHDGTEWKRSTGSMKQENGKWVVTGDVLNPVSGYELLQYQGMCWWDGVTTIDEMMAPVTQKSSWVSKLGDKVGETVPAWTFYFECMIDDDQLQLDLANGRKVPYELYNLLAFFGSVKQTDDSSWRQPWKQNAWRYLSVESAMAYTAFTDYLAAVDQRAKNMQPMFFLEDGASVENGHYASSTVAEPVRMYLNKVYDCDTCNGVDNDGLRNLDPDIDPNKMDDEATGYENPYMGKGSILFRNIDAEPELWTSAGGASTLNLKGVIGAMRSRTAQIDGRTLIPFSPEGAQYFFVEKRLMFWPKKISSYDGERKYIDSTPRANRRYFYALSGLGLTSLPRFIEQRWAIRDGYYQTGAFFDDPLTVRMASLSDNSKITIKAAGTGYFGIGNDAGQTTSKTVFLNEGESYSFQPDEFAHGQAEIRIYQPGRIREIDLSEMSLASGETLSKLTLCERLTLGGIGHTSNPATGFGSLSAVQLGEMPFLEDLDMSYTTATSVDASGCPRIKHLYADNTQITECKVAQTAPIIDLTLPATITRLELVNLPLLSYPGGLVLAGTGNVSRLWVEGCPRINPENLLLEIGANRQLREVRVPDLEITASPVLLQRLMTSGAVGLDAKGNAYAESGRCSGLSGLWIMSDYTDAELIATLSNYFVLLNVLNQQFSTVIFSDDESDAENLSNADNKTGFKYSTDSLIVPYSPSGHVVRLRDTAPIVRAKLNTATGKMEIRQLDRDSLLKYADGTAFDPTDGNSQGYDVMKYIPRYWYKGVNDFVKSEKLFYISTNTEKPLSTAHKVVSKQIKDFTVQRDVTLATDSQTVGGDPVTSDSTTTIVVTVPVKGMKLVRFPGFNSAAIGNVFVDDMGKIVEVFTFANSKSDMQTGDYLIARIPEGAESIIFTAPRGNDNAQVVLSDSDNVESMEPDWLVHHPELIGVYQGSHDSQKHLRSISGTSTTVVGQHTPTNDEWTYDGEGNVTNLVAPSMNYYSPKDISNTAAFHGKGFQLQDYESWKDFAVMAMCIKGTRDMQACCGYGALGLTSGGYDNSSPNGFSVYPPAIPGNNIWGLQNYIGCIAECLDNVAMNVASFRAFRKNRSLPATSDPYDYRWVIFNPATGEERKVQCVTGTVTNGVCISKFRWGRHCDITPSQTTPSHADWSLYTGDVYYCSPNGAGRILIRSGRPNAQAGLCSIQTGVGSGALNYTYSYGAAGRLAFRGEIVSVDK